MTRLVLIVVLGLSGCRGLDLEATLEWAMHSWDWSKGTEMEFWETYPQFRAEYDRLVKDQNPLRRVNERKASPMPPQPSGPRF